jgi:hypothetical protein
MRVRAVALAVLIACLAPASAGASVPALRGAATHPLWDEVTRADFDQELDLVQEAGANEVRADIGWATLERASKGSYDTAYVAKADQFFADAHARGIKVVVTLWQTPCWASSAPDGVKQGCAGAWWDRGVDKYPPTDPADFADAAAYIADRWGADIAAVEVWNEPNFIPDFFHVDSRTEAEDEYAALLNATYPAVKDAAPNVAVIGPAMLDSDWTFLDALYDRGLAANSDGIALRPFNGGRDPRSTEMPPTGDEAASFLLGVPKVREVMADNGDSATKLWFTEVGWSSCTNQPPPATQNSWCIGEAKQAQYIADAYRIVRDQWDFVQLFSVYTLRNTGTDASDREVQMGMLRQDFDPKPSWDAFRSVLAEPVPQPQPAPSQGAAAPVSAAAPPAEAKQKATPGLSRLWLSHGVLTYKLKQRSRVSVVLQRRVHGRWARVRKTLTLKGKRGTNRVRLAKLLGKRRLPRGRYQLALVAQDSVGARSAPSRITFVLR